MRPTIVASTIWAPAYRPPAGPSINPLGVTTGDLSGATAIIVSDPLPVDLFVYRGDSGRFRVQVTDPDGTPLDVSAASWDCDIRSTFDATPVIVSLVVTPVDMSTVEVVLDALKSSLLVDLSVWDLEMTIGGEVVTLLAGTVHVRKDVSRQ